MMSDSIQLHPNAQRLRDEIELLREELAERVAELDELQFMVKPHLMAVYQTKLGPWDLRLLKAKWSAARLRRKIELVQASLNRGEAPDIASIEGALELEFLAWRQRMAEAVQKLEAAQFRLSHLLPEDEAAAIKRLYRSLVKKLHPDFNPNQSAQARTLFLQVVAAYEAGDYEKLKTLELLARFGDDAPDEPSTMEGLRKEHERLRKQIARLYEQLGEIQKQPPFSMRKQWEDDAWVEARRAEVESQIAALEEQAKALETHFRALVIVHDAGKQFGLN